MEKVEKVDEKKKIDAVDFSSFLGDVADAWGDEMNEDRDEDKDDDVVDGW